MSVKITTRHFEISDSTYEFMEGKLEKLKRFAPNADEISVVATQQKNRYISEIKIKAGKFEADAKEEGLDLIVVFEACLKQLEKQVKKHKEKQIDSKKQAKKKLAEVVLPEVEPEEPLVIKKSITVQPMFEIEALAKFSDSDEIFLIFKNQKTDKINILIRESETKIKQFECK